MNADESDQRMDATPLRIAVIGTPRSGSTWFRQLLSQMYKIPSGAFDALEPEAWDQFPNEYVLQLHCRREPAVLKLLEKHRFHVVTMSRHPLDVLISILHFAWFFEGTDDWLCGAGGDEKSIRGAMPRSVPFARYATGPRAAELFAVTADWWDAPGTLSVRYETLVDATEAELTRLASVLGPPRADLKEIIGHCSLDRLRAKMSTHHFWKGQPGHWRRLLTSVEVAEIAPQVEAFCRKLGYECMPDPALTAAEADAGWIALMGGELVASMRKLGTEKRESLQARQKIEELERDINLLRHQLGTKQQATQSLAGFPIAMADRIHAIRCGHPGFYGVVRRLLGRSRKRFAPSGPA